MDITLKSILDNQVLNEDTKNALEKVFIEKINETKKALEDEYQEKVRGIEQQVKSELAERYEHDKEILSEAVEKFISNGLTKHLEELHEDRKKILSAKNELNEYKEQLRKEFKNKFLVLSEKFTNVFKESIKNELSSIIEDRKSLNAQRVQYAKVLTEAKETYKNVINEKLEKFDSFANEVIKKELEELKEERKQLVEEQKLIKSRYNSSIKFIEESYVSRIKKLEDFSLSKLKTHISELVEDRKILNSTKQRMINENKEYINLLTNRLVKKAASSHENFIVPMMKQQMSELKEELISSRQKHFGMKLFEAFATEFMASHYSETKNIKKLAEKVQKLEKDINTKEKLIENMNKEKESMNSKLKALSESTKRNEKIKSLVQSLPVDKRTMMNTLLETVKYENLDSQFQKYLPQVIRNDYNKVSKQVITETNTHVVTGDRKNITIVEANDDLENMRRLAGLK